MKIFKNKYKLQNQILNIKNISFVPTMGGLHKGHISLIKKAKILKGKTLVSIFVNPKQFNEKKDFFNYPRSLKKDLRILKKLKVNFVYIPNSKDIFSFKPKNKIFLDKFSKKLCGKTRKGHFEGVLDIVNRFLEIIKPKYIFLGNKDFQQSYLIYMHIFKRNIKTKIIHCKTIREKSGLAFSTRNKNLDNHLLNIASNVVKYLKNQKKLIKKKFNKRHLLKLKKNLLNLGVSKIDYLELYNLKTLKPPKNKRDKFNIFFALYFKKIRLIDNF